MTVHPIVEAARSWIGTRFAHQGRLKKTSMHQGGVDCLGLLVGIARELKLKDNEGNALKKRDLKDYGHNAETYRLEEALDNLFERLPVIEAAPGDILLIKLEAFPQHLAVASEYYSSEHRTLGMIHAYAAARKVVEHRLDSWWKERIVGVYRVN